MILRRIPFALAAAVVAPCIFVQVTTAQGTTTTTTVTRDTTIGPIGVASTETIQINVVNLASNASNGAAASCAGSITFNSSGGTPIGASTPFTVTAGQIFSASLPFAKTGSTANRVEVMGVLSQTSTLSSSSAEAPCDLRYSVETYDSTSGVTHVYINGDGSTVSPILPVVSTPTTGGTGNGNPGGGNQGGGNPGGGNQGGSGGFGGR